VRLRPDTREHALFFLYGTGGNGKGVYLGTLAGILGNYHVTAPIETFTASNVDSHPTELARLHGARVVTSTETEEGRRWAESRIKMLTGGDHVSARFMRQDFFEYSPQFKLLISGNHKPGLRSVDEAIRRRLNLVPFNVTIPTAQRDVDLLIKLRAEWPGILAKMIAGCLEWQRIGLMPPAIVRNATAAYLENEDAVAAWIDDCCQRDVNAFEPSNVLFASWKAWAEANGEYVGNQRQFANKLLNREVQQHRKSGRSGRGYRGLRLVGDAPSYA
jgi:putative DNA primase/helicase